MLSVFLKSHESIASTSFAYGPAHRGYVLVVTAKMHEPNVLEPAAGSRGRGGYGLAQGARTSGRAAGGHGGTDAGGGKGRLIFLYSLRSIYHIL